MNLIKTIFILSLLNLVVLVSILIYFSSLPSIAIPTTPSSISVIPAPTLTPSAQTPSSIKTTPTITTPKPTLAVATPTPDQRCVITVDGFRFDVTIFRRLHSGGDVFTCGADLSQLFHTQHPNSFLSKMARYKI